jgi:hypothetical protein
LSEESPEYEDIDYTSIRFPSDRLDIGAMRRVHPDLFDVEDAEYEQALAVIPEGFHSPDHPEIGQMLHLERMLARNAYEEVRGDYTQSNFITPTEKPSYHEDLTAYYLRYRLATGPHQAEEMIRDFEAQAARQVRALGRGGP